MRGCFLKQRNIFTALFAAAAILPAAGSAADPTPMAAPPLTGVGAQIETFGPCEVDVFQPGVKLYTDRAFTLKDGPAYLRGKPLLRGSISRSDLRCSAPGLLTLITPAPEHPRACSLGKQLEERGFLRVEPNEAFQLFGNQPFDRVYVYQKQLKQGERLRLGKWAVAVGFGKATPRGDVKTAWSENRGELLYNGIRLPEEWPPQDIDPHSTEPMRVPYLEAPPQVIPIDVGRQLLVDDFLIEKTDLARRCHHPVKYEGNPILKPETPLELHADGNPIACPKSGGLWWDADEKCFKLWYEAGWLNTICYATSRDGLDWRRPALDIEPGTNRVLPVDMKCDSWTVVRDYWTADPQQKYKMFVRAPGRQGPGVSMVSPDGVHWSNRVESGPTGDRSTMFYNPFRKKWVYSLRSSFRGRSRHYWECDDFLAGARWKTHEPVIWAAVDRLDPPDPNIGDTPTLYNLDAVAYESIMLGFFEIHLGPPNTDCKKVGLPKITELQFAYSRDGFHWHRPDRTPAIRAERRDVWDRGYVQSLGNLGCVRGDRLWFYYIGFQGNAQTAGNGPHNGMYARGSTGVAFLRRDGFASLEAAEKPGALTTRLIRFSGSRLFVNANAKQGALRAEILDAEGRAIAPFTLANCQAVQSDGTLEPLRWNGADDLSSLRDRPVRIRFALERGAALYSFWVSRDASGRSDGYVAGGGPGFTGPTDTVGRAALDAERKLTLPAAAR